MQCSERALFRYTWPGKDESFICMDHALQLRGIAQALGLHLQMIVLDGSSEEMCRQEVKVTAEEPNA